jgi:hypothetical protein
MKKKFVSCRWSVVSGRTSRMGGHGPGQWRSALALRGRYAEPDGLATLCRNRPLTRRDLSAACGVPATFCHAVAAYARVCPPAPTCDYSRSARHGCEKLEAQNAAQALQMVGVELVGMQKIDCSVSCVVFVGYVIFSRLFTFFSFASNVVFVGYAKTGYIFFCGEKVSPLGGTKYGWSAARPRL